MKTFPYTLRAMPIFKELNPTSDARKAFFWWERFKTWLSLQESRFVQRHSCRWFGANPRLLLWCTRKQLIWLIKRPVFKETSMSFSFYYPRWLSHVSVSGSEHTGNVSLQNNSGESADPGSLKPNQVGHRWFEDLQWAALELTLNMNRLQSLVSVLTRKNVD